MPNLSLARLFRSFSGLGLLLGTLAFAASLTPSLVPRAAVVLGLLGGFSLAAGYGIGVLLRAIWAGLQLPTVQGRARQIGNGMAVAACVAVAGLSLWWAAGWQNRLRALMDMAPIESAGPWTIAGVTLLIFALLLLIVRAFLGIRRRLFRGLARRIPGPQAALIAIILTAVLFFAIGDGVLVSGVMRVLDNIYAELDGRFEATSPQPSDPLKTGGPGSLLTWEGLGRAGREAISQGPSAAEIAALSGTPAKEPLRVYVGLNSAEDPAARV